MLEKLDKKELLNKLDKKELLYKFGKKNIMIAASVAVVLLIGVMAYLSSPGHQYVKELKTAQKNFTKGRYEEAVTAYQTAYGIYQEKDNEKAKAVLTDMAGSYDKLISSQLESGLYEEAGATFEAAGNAIATVNDNGDDITECAQGCTWLWEREKLDLYIAVGEADSMVEEEQYAEACTRYKELWDTIYERTEDYIPELKERIKTGTEVGRFALAEQLIAEKQYTLAGEQYDALLAIVADNEEAHTGRVNMYLYENDVVAAIEQLEKAEKACPNEKWQERKEYIVANSRMESKKKYNADDVEKEGKEALQTWTYNENGDVISEESDSGEIKQFTYDESGKITIMKHISPSKSYNVITYVYDEKDCLIEEKNEFYALETSEAPKWITTNTYEYYDNGQQKSEKVVEVRDSEEQILRDNMWNENGKPLRESKGDEVKEYTYRDDGTLLTKTTTKRSSGESTVVSYNALGVPVYDGEYEGWNYAYNEAGELTSSWKDDTVITYEYDEKHRLVRYICEREAGTAKEDFKVLSASQYEMIRGDRTTGYDRMEKEFVYDDKGRITERYVTHTVEKVYYENRKSGAVYNGISYKDTTGKGVYVPTFAMDANTIYTEIVYGGCGEKDEERIGSPWEWNDRFNFDLQPTVPDSEGFRFADYYQYDGNWRVMSYTTNGEKTNLGRLTTKETEEEREEKVTGEKNIFGNVVKTYADYGQTAYVYEYRYIFEGKIE